MFIIYFYGRFCITTRYVKSPESTLKNAGIPVSVYGGLVYFPNRTSTYREHVLCYLVTY